MSETPALNNTSASQEAQTALLDQAAELLKKKDLAGSFLLVKEYWLLNPADARAPKLLAEIMHKNGKKGLRSHLEKLCGNDQKLQDDAQSLFEAGYELIEEREPELAVMLLGRCAELVPEEAIVRYELGFALMQLRRFSEAIPQFEYLLTLENDFDTKLNLAVCHSLGRNVQRAEELLRELESIAKSNEEKKELDLRRCVLKRLRAFEPHTPMSTRDWVYALYGSIIVSDTTPKDLSGKPRALAADYIGVASTLLLLKGFLEHMGTEFDLVEYYNPSSRPLAEAMARLLNLPAEPYKGTKSQERSLLMMCWASDIIGPHKVFVENAAKRSIFAYGLTTLTQLPVTPDIIGCLAAECVMPWAEQLDKAELLPDKKGALPAVHPMNQVQSQATDQILAHASNLESNTEIIKNIEDLALYYGSRRKHLVFCNSESFAERPEYTSEIPC